MASPQKENGYVPIANELSEAFARIRIAGEAWQVLNVILRKTYGFNKKEDAISLSQFVLATGLKKQTIIKALSKLKALNVVTQKGYGSANIYRINKDFDTWNPLPKKVTITQKGYAVTQKGKDRNPKRYIQKTVLKDTITKDNTQEDFPEAEVIIHGEPEIHESPPVSLDLSLLAETFQPVNRRWRKMLDDHEQVTAGNECLKSHGLTHLLSVAKALEKTNEIRYMPVITNLIELRDKLTKWELQLKKLAKESEKNQVLI